jgi:hypothetical protein
MMTVVALGWRRPVLKEVERTPALRVLYEFEVEKYEGPLTKEELENLDEAMQEFFELEERPRSVGGLPAPRLAGQSYEYLVEAMRRYAEGEQTNSTDMTNIMKALSTTEREAMARYISGF